MKSTVPGISLQISLAPNDLAHARYVLPHQLRRWAHQADETVLVIDAGQPQDRHSHEWKQKLAELRRLVDERCVQHRNARVVEVDYSPDVAREIAMAYFGRDSLPAKDWNGTAFYAYFFGLWSARHRYVLHMDSDMLYGGGSTTWAKEAVELLTQRSDVLMCSPLPGPPTDDGRLTSQTMQPELHTSLAYSATWMNTRVFLLDTSRFQDRIGHLSLTRPPWRHVLRAAAEGRSPYELPEEIISQAMVRHGLLRFDFLGLDPGMWSLHPPYRSTLFYDRLPSLVEAVEAGMVPDAQRGDYDINDSMVDWTSARMSRRQKLTKHRRLVTGNVTAKLARVVGRPVRRQTGEARDAL
jgi:hypothetical protein